MHVSVADMRANPYLFADGIQENVGIFQFTGMFETRFAQSTVIFDN
jgi:hypothetical protein